MFLLWERRESEPLVPLGLFANRTFSIMVWLNVLVSFAMYGMLLLTTIDLQPSPEFPATVWPTFCIFGHSKRR